VADSRARLVPPRDDSVGVFTRADYVADGGEALADLAESLFMEAAEAIRR
jgi:Mn-containing catalase